ncbi:hypothetical protein O9993_15870 [Vibrio lentus]|nr:hypothetical protein [Vibrio lentus]
MCGYEEAALVWENSTVGQRHALKSYRQMPDLSVTVGDLPDSTSRAIKLGDLQQVLAAPSPDYLAKAKFKLPITSSDLCRIRLHCQSMGRVSTINNFEATW